MHAYCVSFEFILKSTEFCVHSCCYLNAKYLQRCNSGLTQVIYTFDNMPVVLVYIKVEMTG